MRPLRRATACGGRWWVRGLERYGRSCPPALAWVVVARGGHGTLSGFWGNTVFPKPWASLVWSACFVLLVLTVVGAGRVGVVWSGVGGLVVNCIVDASIFDLCKLFVCFFERSVDALASGADEGRGGLR